MKSLAVRGTLAAFLVCLGATATGCKAIPVEMHTTTHIQHADGTVEHKETHWKGTLDELPAQLGKAGEDLEQVTAKMAKELTDVPPPGQVKLGTLHPSFAKYEGKDGQDFLVGAKNKDGTPIDFKYVRLGAPSYDEFFKTAQEIYAICWQTKQTVHRLREASAAVLKTNVDASGAVKAQVDKAIGTAGADADIVAELKALSEMAQNLSALVSQLAQKVGKLVQTGEGLVAGAAASLTNPKVATHLGLVKEGLTDSIAVIKQSGVLMVDLGKDLTGYGS
jgi:hypothetical protein